MEFIKSAYLRSMGAQILCLILFGLAGVASAGSIDDVRASVYAWSKSWQNRDIDAYMSFYSKNFQSKGLDYRGWMRKKKMRFHMVGSLRVNISDLEVFIEGDTAVARFIQRYHDSKISDVGEKTLNLLYTAGRWQIVAEEWKELKAPARISGEWETASEPQKRAPAPSPVDDAKQIQSASALSKPGIVVKSIKFESQKKLEKLFIASNKYFVPKVLTLEGDNPKVVIVIKPVSSWNGPYITPIKGKLVRQIRTYLHPASGTLRIVLDLNPSENYHINQIYYEKKNICCIEIK